MPAWQQAVDLVLKFIVARFGDQDGLKSNFSKLLEYFNFSLYFGIYDYSYKLAIFGYYIV